MISVTGELLIQAGVHEKSKLVTRVPAGPATGTIMLAWEIVSAARGWPRACC